MADFFDNLGNSISVALLEESDETGIAFNWPGGEGLFVVNGTWDGATASLEYSLNEDWVTLGESFSLTADQGIMFTLPSGPVRCAIASAGESTSLTAYIKRA